MAHGEGKFLMADQKALEQLDATGQIVLKYADQDGLPTKSYPTNPNGSALAAAGLCDPSGRIFGLMPHPERFVNSLQHPRWTRMAKPPGESDGQGLRIFQGALTACR